MANRKQIQLKDLEAGAVYVLQIRAVDNLGTTSPWSPKITIETIKDTIAPNAPSGLTWQVSGDDFVATWTEPTLNEDGSVTEDLKDYKVTLYDPAVPGTKKHYYTASERFEFNFAQNKAAFGAPEKRLTIEVRSRDLGGNTSATPTSKTAENGDPGNFTLDAVGERRAIVLNWDSPADYGDVATDNPVQNGLDISEFDIYRGGVFIATVAGNTYTYNDADPGRGDHTYFIRARDVYGGETDSNNDTASASGYWEEDTVAPAAPTLVAGTPTYALINDGLEVEASFSWNAPTTNTDATPYEDHEGFQIRYGKNASGPWQYIDIVDTRTNGTDAQQFTENVDGLDPGTTYYWGVRARDRYQNYSTWATTNKASPADTTAPNTPSTPSASGSTNYVLVSHDMNDNGADGTVDPLPRDTVKLKVYISDDAVAGANFTPDDTAGTGNLEGEIDVVPGIPAVQSFNYPVTDATESAGTVDVWVKVKAVDIAGNVSAASAAGQVDVNLIENVNILDATIEAAKIGSVFANSIVAGTGLINDLTVKANLTLGDNVTDGVIQSYPYTQDPSTGFYMDDIVGLIVNDGKISAGALEIHDSPNLMDAGYADFEYAESWYTAHINLGPNQVMSMSSTSRYRAQSLSLETTAAASFISYAVLEDPNAVEPANPIPIDSGTEYIVSAWVYGAVGGEVCGLRVRWSDGAGGTFNEYQPDQTLAAGWQRIYFTVDSSNLTNAQYASIQLGVNPSTTVLWDGLQMEEKVGNSDQPSFFKIGGATTIDGGNLSTGTIDANNVSIQGLGGSGRVVIDGGGIGLWTAETGGDQLIDIDTNGTFYLRTSDTNNRVQFDGAGLRMYNAGTELIDLNSSGTFTIRTGSTGSRVVLDGTGIKLYDSGGNINVNLDAVTGNGTFKGQITATSGLLQTLDVTGTLTLSGSSAAFRSSTSGRRVAIEDDDALYAYHGDDLNWFRWRTSGASDPGLWLEYNGNRRWVFGSDGAVSLDYTGSVGAFTINVTGSSEPIRIRKNGVPVLIVGDEGSFIGDGARPAVVAHNPGDNRMLLQLSSERPWTFVQRGTGAGAHLELQSNIDKVLYLTNSSRDIGIELHPNGGLVRAARFEGLSGSAAKVTELEVNNQFRIVTGSHNYLMSIFIDSGRLRLVEGAAFIDARNTQDTAYGTYRAAAFTVSSARRYKQDVAPTNRPDSVTLLRSLRPVTYRHAHARSGGPDDRLTRGFVVEDLPDELVIPAMLSPSEAGESPDANEDGTVPFTETLDDSPSWSVAEVVALLTDGLQDALDRIEALERRR